MPRIKAITFDLWDTLIQEIPEHRVALLRQRKDALHDKLGALGHHYDIGDIESAYQLSGEYLQQIWARDRDLPVDDHLLLMLSCIDSRLPSKLGPSGIDELREIYIDTLLRLPPELFDDVEYALKSLSDSGFRLGLISNTGRTPGSVLRILLRDLKIDHYFDFMTFSNETLVRKPERGIFKHALSGLHVAPRLSVHVGDNRVADFEGANKAGMLALIIDRDSSGEGPEPNTINSLEELLKLFQ